MSRSSSFDLWFLVRHSCQRVWVCVCVWFYFFFHLQLVPVGCNVVFLLLCTFLTKISLLFEAYVKSSTRATLQGVHFDPFGFMSFFVCVCDLW